MRCYAGVVFFVLVAGFCCKWPVFGGNNYSALNLVDVKPGTLQLEAMRADSLGGRPVYDSQTKDLWMVGKLSVWRWNLDNSSVTRFELPLETRAPFHTITAQNNEFWGFDQRFIWVLDQRSRRWSRVGTGFDPQCAVQQSIPINLENNEDCFFVLTGCGGQMLSTKEKKIQMHPFKVPLKSTDARSFAGVDQDGEFIVFPRDLELSRYRLKGSIQAHDVIYASKSNLKGVTRDENGYLAWTAKAMIFFDNKFKRQRVVPVVGKRKITTVAVSRGLHALLFDDGVLEVMSTKSKRKWFANNLPQGTQHVDFIEDAKYLLVSAALMEPQVFRVTIE